MRKLLQSIGLLVLLNTSTMAYYHFDKSADNNKNAEDEATQVIDNSKGAYIGLGYGLSYFYDGGLGDDAKDAFAPSLNENYTSSGYELYAGYQFNKLVAIEASYTKYGEFSVDNTDDSGQVGDIILNPMSLGVTANLGNYLDENNEYRVFVMLGLSYTNLDESGKYRIYQNDKTGAIRFGLGFEYFPMNFNGFGFRVAYKNDLYFADSGGDTYTQLPIILYLGVQYKF